jgi:hypothetical protein
MSEKIIPVENGMEDGMELDNPCDDAEILRDDLKLDSPRDDAEADAEILREDRWS